MGKRGHPADASRPLFLLLLILFVSFFPLLPVKAEAESSSRVTVRRQFSSAHHSFPAKTEETFTVEVVREKEEMKQGLSGRDRMADERGMLFLLDSSQDYAFWMKDVRFPLDIVFADRDGTITEILEELRPCSDCKVHFPKGHPAYALEINGGLARKFGFGAGDRLIVEP